MDLSIVIPAYKEANKIAADVTAADEFLTRAGLAGEIILVDDGSTDDTLERAKGLQTQYQRLVVVTYRKNRGKGHALKQGMKVAQGRFVMFADAGLCVPYEIAGIALTMLDLDMCDIAHGSRRMRGSVKVRQPLYRRLGARAFAVLSHGFVGVPLWISDTQCGFKLYRRDVAKRLYAELDHRRLHVRRGDHFARDKGRAPNIRISRTVVQRSRHAFQSRFGFGRGAPGLSADPLGALDGRLKLRRYRLAGRCGAVERR